MNGEHNCFVFFFEKYIHWTSVGVARNWVFHFALNCQFLCWLTIAFLLADFHSNSRLLRHYWLTIWTNIILSSLDLSLLFLARRSSAHKSQYRTEFKMLEKVSGLLINTTLPKQHTENVLKFLVILYFVHNARNSKIREKHRKQTDNSKMHLKTNNVVSLLSLFFFFS